MHPSQLRDLIVAGLFALIAIALTIAFIAIKYYYDNQDLNLTEATVLTMLSVVLTIVATFVVWRGSDTWIYDMIQ